MSNIKAVDDFLANHEDVFDNLKNKLIKAQEIMKHFADKHRKDITFQIGDWVFVRLHPHRQISTTGESYSKLVKRFYGSYQILWKIVSVAYELQLLEGSRIHPVFHCSILKPCHQPSRSVDTAVDLPPTTVDHQPVISPLAILNTRWDYSKYYPKLMVLVQWKGLSPYDTLWEEYGSLKVDQHLEDNVLFDERRDVMKGIIQLPSGTTDTSIMQQPGTTPGTTGTSTSRNQRPKQRITKPRHLRDFV